MFVPHIYISMYPYMDVWACAYVSECPRVCSPLCFVDRGRSRHAKAQPITHRTSKIRRGTTLVRICLLLFWGSWIRT